MTRQSTTKITCLLLAVSFLLACARVWAQGPLTGVRTVSNTNESGPGSLRQAILDANTHVGPDLIRFDIPQTDPGFVAYVDDGVAGEFDPYAGVVSAWDPLADPDSPRWWQIGLVEEGLPPLSDDETTLDGATQTTNHGDTNIYGPEIQVINLTEEQMNGMGISGDQNVVRNLTLNNFSNQLGISGNENVVTGCYLGFDPSGRVGIGPLTLQAAGIGLGQRNVFGGLLPGEGNILAGGSWLTMIVESAHQNQILGNHFNVNAMGTKAFGGGEPGLSLEATNDTVVEGNVFGGPRLSLASSAHTIITHNYFGVDPSGLYDLGIYSNESILIYNSPNNQIGPGNVIFNGDIGVHVEGEASVGNVITQNRISHNEDAGIRLTQGGNNQMAAPFIRDAYTNAAWGVAVPGAIVELFSDAADEGEIYEGKVVAGPDGSFAWFGVLTGPMVTATATDQAGNTSQFSLPAPMNGAASWLFLPLWVKWE